MHQKYYSELIYSLGVSGNIKQHDKIVIINIINFNYY